MIYLDLFFAFLKVGLFSFGGAYGAIPLIRDTVMSYGWLNEETLTYIIAVSESTPGSIMVNLATYIGSTQGGVPGSIIATLAVVLPAFFIILLITALLNSVLKNKYIQAVLNGLKPCVIGIVLATGAYMIFENCMISENGLQPDYTALIISVLLALIMLTYKLIRKKKLSPVLLIILSAVIGIIIYGI